MGDLEGQARRQDCCEKGERLRAEPKSLLRGGQKEIDSYLQELRDGTDRDLRRRFKEKMDKLSRRA